MVILLLACTNTMTPAREAPFDLGRVVSSLFVEDAASNERSDYGRATLVMSSRDIRCADVKSRDWLYNDETTPVWKGDHLVATVYWSYSPFDWEDYQEGDGRAGWQGLYGSSISVSERLREGAVYRSFWAEVYSEGTAWGTDGQLGLLEIEDSNASTVSGSLDHQSVDANFKAQNCGSQVNYDSGYRDSGYW